MIVDLDRGVVNMISRGSNDESIVTSRKDWSADVLHGYLLRVRDRWMCSQQESLIGLNVD